MRQLVFTSPGQVGWEDAPDPVAPDDGVVVRPAAVSRCDLDAPMAALGLFPGPFPVGHELVGEVVEVGAGVDHWTTGDQVVVPFQVSCGTCPTCARGHFAACEPHRASAGAAFGFGPAGGDHPGALADLVAVPHADHLLQRAPAGVAPGALAPAADNLLDGWRAVVPPLEDQPGADVLVVGGLAASVGLYAVLAATVHGAGTVTYVDDDADRLRAAADLGADTLDVADGWPDRLPRAAVVVDNTGTADGLRAAVRATAAYGTCTSVGIQFGGDVSMPLLAMYTRGITFHTSRADARRYLPRVLPEVADGRLDPARVPTRTVGWEEAAEAWLAPAIKLVVTRDDASA